MVDKEAVEEATGSCWGVVATSISVVGAEKTLSKICQLLINGNQVKIIGIYGMGGVGKTTLLNMIRSEMGSHFKVVISVSVSKEVNVLKIQESIGEQLFHGLPAVERQRARFLFAILSRINVLLLLDDVWEKLDLVRIGIPLVSNGKHHRCKVVFTTRSEAVCIAMETQENVKVKPLPESESWELFSSMIGDRVDLNKPSIKPLAKEVVAKCGGLPLTLLTVGKAMEDATTVREWENAIKNLKHSPIKIQRMHNVFSLLKKSYDRLRNDSLRWCFLYCVSFPSYPEHLQIDVTEIVNYWVREGIFSGDSLLELLLQANEVIDELRAACLLEDCGRNYVKMHSGIRNMALWISSGEDSGNHTNVIFSYAGLGLTQWPITERWGDAKLISLIENGIKKFPDDDMPDCPKLSSLLINDNPRLKKPIPESFFRSMPILRVLNLSFTGIKELPKSIGLLVELQYLNLSHTNIHSLPEEMGNLQKLRDLLLSYTKSLRTVSRRVILKLPALQRLDLSCSNFIWDASDNIADGSEEEISIQTAGLETLNQIEELKLTIATSRFLRVLLSSRSWSNAMRYLSLEVKDLTISDLSTALEYMNGLTDLQICNALELNELILDSGKFLNLQSVKLLHLPMLKTIAPNKLAVKNRQILPGLTNLVIERCNLLSDFSLVHRLSTLTIITLHFCNGLEELQLHNGSNEADRLSCSVPNLKSLELGWLPNLRSISTHPLFLPSLEFIFVYGCPKLKRLPFGARSARKIYSIRGSQIWWDGLVWNPNTDKAFFRRIFTPDMRTEDQCEIHVEGDDVDDDEEEDSDEADGSKGEHDRKRTRRCVHERL